MKTKILTELWDLLFSLYIHIYIVWFKRKQKQNVNLMQFYSQINVELYYYLAPAYAGKRFYYHPRVCVCVCPSVNRFSLKVANWY